VNRPDRSRRAPWSANDLTVLIVIVAAGGILCAIGWNGASTRSRLDDQTGWITLGVAGFAVAVAGQTIWLRRGRRAVAAHAARVRGNVSCVVQDRSRHATLTARPDEVVATERMRHFHRPNCPIARGRGWAPVPRRTHEAAGRTPCGICAP
jgi:hypothetical protein